MSEIWSEMSSGLHVRYLLLLSDFNGTWVYSNFFSPKNTQIWNFMKIRPVGSQLFHANGRTNMMKLIAAFRNFTNALQNAKYCTISWAKQILLMAHATSRQTFSRTIYYPSSFYSHLPAYEDETECSETSAYKLQTPGNNPKESIQILFI